MWIIEQLLNGIHTIVNDIWTTFFSFIETFFSGEIVLDVFYMSPIKTAAKATTGIATLFLGIIGGKHIITTYVLETEGDKEMDPLQFLVKVSISTAIIQSSDFLITYLIKLSQLACEQIVGNKMYETFSSGDLFDPESLSAYMASWSVGLLYILVFMICVFAILIKAAFRIAELAAMKVLFPLFCCDIVTAGRERWNAFIMSFLVTIFGYIVQLLMLNMSIRIYLEPVNNASFILAYGCLFFALKAPKFLERFTYSTGLGQSVGHSAIYMAPQIMRFFK